uniref:Delta-like protein n=1 Tax=Steinernema glaseri TaxID=37863 RepID=A0A1I7ZW68_9BILA
MFAPSGRLALLLILLSSYSSLINAKGTIQLRLHTWDYAQPSCCDLGQKLSGRCDCFPFLKICIGLIVPTPFEHPNCSVAYVDRVSLEAPQLLDLPFAGRWLHSDLQLTAEVVSELSGKTLDRVDLPMRVFPRNGSVLKVHREFEGSRLDFSFTVRCAKGLFGDKCARACREDSKTMCDSEGKRVCRPGWTGALCQQPVCKDGCLHGVCVAPDTCRCEAGWQGHQCTECVPHKNCVHGTCAKPFDCVCKHKWGGTWCDKDLDVCEHEKPCQNGGRCSSQGLVDSYFCNCTAGFEGKNCEIAKPVDVGSRHEKCDCSANGRCVSGRCECDAGFEGARCERRSLRPFSSDVCLLEDGSRRANGAKWTELDCRQCTCRQGKVECSEAKCEHRDCVRYFGICPFDQTCMGVEDSECLKGECPRRQGFCKPWSHTSSQRKHSKCLPGGESEECSRFLLQFNSDRLESGTTVEAVCHHLALTLFAERLTNYAFECKKSGEALVQVTMMSVQRDFHIGKVKRGLLAKLRHNTTVSPLLRSVLHVLDPLESLDSLVKWDSKEDSPPGFSSTELLVGVLALLLLVVAILLVLSLWRRSSRSASDEDRRTPPPETKVAFLETKCPQRCPSPPPAYDSLPSPAKSVESVDLV